MRFTNLRYKGGGGGGGGQEKSKILCPKYHKIILFWLFWVY